MTNFVTQFPIMKQIIWNFNFNFKTKYGKNSYNQLIKELKLGFC